MNINEADQTYSVISSSNSDNLMWFSLFSFLQQRAFIFVTKNYLYIWSLKNNIFASNEGKSFRKFPPGGENLFKELNPLRKRGKPENIRIASP